MRPEKKQGARKGGSFVPAVPELETAESPSEDRYAQMAVQAEKLQRDKVLAEARAAVAAATSHEGEGRRKKRKEKREAENRERLEMEAIEKGLDPELVLDDSVVEVPQGATVSKFAEAIGVQPNDVIKRLFMLGQVLNAHAVDARRPDRAHRRRHGAQGARRVARRGIRRWCTTTATRT